MPQFRKKPVVIEARNFGPDEDWNTLVEWCGGKLMGYPDGSRVIVISTLEGEMEASLGDWIIKGVKGEFYPCKPDVCAETYEAS